MSVLRRLGLDEPLCAKSHQKAHSDKQEQTKISFSFIWARRNCYESPAIRNKARDWLFERYCDGNPDRLKRWLTGGRKIILDAGCGSGFSSILFFGDLLKEHDYLGVDISDAIDVAKERFRERVYPGDFLKMDLKDLAIPDGSVDVVFSEGVLHHTDSTEESVVYLAKKLRRGGRFLFYVYAKKPVIREFTDDYIRKCLQGLSDEEAWEALKPWTKLGVALGSLNVEIEVPEDIPFLGIKRGKFDLQRFFYWNIGKLYYRPEFCFEEMHITNYDWFRPLNCHRHTKEEVVSYCEKAGLEIEHMNVQESGITVVARKI